MSDKSLGKGVFEPDTLQELRLARTSARESGLDIVDLTMVCPDFAPPRVLVDRLVEASLKPHSHRYGVSRGVRCLREAFATKYEERFGVKVDSEEEVCATLGTKDALQHLLQEVARPGDTILIGTPVYPVFLSLAEMQGLRVVTFSMAGGEHEALQALADAAERFRPKVILLNFPNNPTGQMVGQAFWTRAISVARSVSALLVNDFTYGELAHSSTGTAVSALSVADDISGVIETYSLSKAYCVPGWRVAALLGDRSILRRVARRKSIADYGGFLGTQVAASHALTSSEDLVAPLRMEMRARAQVLSGALRSQGWSTVEPRAGMCLWARPPAGIGVSTVGGVSGAASLARRLGVCVLPGAYFGAEWGDFVRFALVVNEPRLREAARRLQQFELEELVFDGGMRGRS